MTLPAFATYLAQTTFAVSVLIALVLLVRRRFARHFGANASYALWAIPVLRLVLPPMPANWTLLGWLNTNAGAQAPALPTSPEPTISAPTLNANFSFTPINTPTEVTEQASFNLSNALQSAVPLLLGLWVLGVIFAVALILLRQRSAATLIASESQSPSQSLSTLARQTRHGLGMRQDALAIKTSLISSGPFVTGLLKPTVLVPEWFETDYTYTEQKFALTHEMMHIKRGDLWALHVAAFAMALQWFNPLAWIALKAFRSDQEAACDADVLALRNTCPHAYGATLVKSARMSRPVAQPLHAASLPLNHALIERLTIMKNPLPSARQRLTGSLLTASVGAATLLASACAVSAAAQEDTLAAGPEDKEPGIVTLNQDGESKQLILLSDPFADVKIATSGLETLDGDLEGLDEILAELDVEMTAIDGLAIAGEAMSFLADFSGPDMDVEISRFTSQLNAMIEDGNFDEAAIEALAEDFETRMENWAENFEIHFETQSEDWEEKLEARAEAMAARIEAHAERIEAKADLIDIHAGQIEIAGETIEELADQCEGQSVAKIVTARRESAGGETRTHKAICIDNNGSHDSAAILQSLRASGELSDEELSRVEDGLAKAERYGDQSARIQIHKDTEIEN